MFLVPFRAISHESSVFGTSFRAAATPASSPESRLTRRSRVSAISPTSSVGAPLLPFEPSRDGAKPGIGPPGLGLSATCRIPS